MTMHAYSFWSENGTAKGNRPPLTSLSLLPDGRHKDELEVLFHQNTPIEQQLVIADRVLAGVQQWRDGIAEYAEQERTANDDLEAARAEIVRLKAQAGESE
ncbi:hypothetical protein [Streptomyces enissocaesilis]|uniref:Uncharacterized protein n=1 Tax=Streptomyces enissocaesilis TaxID=332589 RepID=A0ABN3WXS9_9ACTN